jgi:hypothetical protein
MNVCASKETHITSLGFTSLLPSRFLTSKRELLPRGTHIKLISYFGVFYDRKTVSEFLQMIALNADSSLFTVADSSGFRIYSSSMDSATDPLFSHSDPARYLECFLLILISRYVSIYFLFMP